MTPQEILDLEMESYELGSMTIRDYLKALLKRLWRDGDNFSSKRPFGNSDWCDDLYAALVRHSVIEGNFDEEGYLANFNKEAGHRTITKAITAL